MLRQIPAVEELLNRPALELLGERVGRRFLTSHLRGVLTAIRQEILAKTWQGALTSEAIEARTEAAVARALTYSLTPVINATGVVLHTNLGRAPLSHEAMAHATEIATQYSNLEYDVAAGRRGERDVHLTGAAELIGAEAAIAVNNNAAAVLLVLNALGEGGEVIVSRGELIEIGGSFRIPEIMQKSGAILREVGTTNRTRIADYRNAINERTKLLLRVHPSNFRIEGFTERPSLDELVALGREKGIPVYEDLGSGCLISLTAQGLHTEQPAGESLAAGVDVISISGDKMLGGPQAGIIAGSKEMIRRIRRNPLFRALRVDKMTYAILESTFRAYAQEQYNRIPALRMIRATAAEVEQQALWMMEGIAKNALDWEMIPGESVIGGGSAPGFTIPTALIALQHKSKSAAALEAHLRKRRPAVLARVENDRLLLDLRTVMTDQLGPLADAIKSLA
ncbi:MAG: L-seryl-tRNA(Sec) selenium transferase [Acidobacteria bacterium]|nr:L-seryl-tRNA(Sec) selenium transferase [Acidobacteriota bacterium]